MEVFCCLLRAPPLGKTSPTPFSPLALPCPPPPVIAHATHSAELGANFTSGMAVNYSCQPGFSLLGASSIWCTAAGSWSRPYPRCAGTGPPWLLLGLASCTQESFGGTAHPETPTGLSLLLAHARCCAGVGGIGNKLVALPEPVRSHQETVMVLSYLRLQIPVFQGPQTIPLHFGDVWSVNTPNWLN